jgi:hypothetical protein
LRKENYAIDTLPLSESYLVFLVFVMLSGYFLDSDLGPLDDIPSGNLLVSIYQFLDLTWPFTMAPLAAISIIPIAMGRTLILRVDKRDVIVALKGFLEKYKLSFTIEEDVVRVPSMKLRLMITGPVWKWDHYGVRKIGLSLLWRRTVHEYFLNAFVGTPSQRAYPAFLIFGLMILMLGIGLGVSLGLD